MNSVLLIFINFCKSFYSHFVEICHRSLPVACFVSNCGKNESHESFPDTTIMNSTELQSLAMKNCRKSERKLKFRVLDRDVKENTICSMCGMCGKKEPDQEGVDQEFDGKSDLIIDCQKCKRWFHQICLVKVGIRRASKILQCIYCQSK